MSDDDKWIVGVVVAVVLFLIALGSGSDGGGRCGNAVGAGLDDCAEFYEERYLSGRG